jgi:hypothetical protein
MQTIMFVFLWVQVIVVFPRQPVSISLYFFCDKIHIFFQVSQISAEVEVRFLTVLLISFNPLSLDNKTLCQEVKVSFLLKSVFLTYSIIIFNSVTSFLLWQLVSDYFLDRHLLKEQSVIWGFQYQKFNLCESVPDS